MSQIKDYYDTDPHAEHVDKAWLIDSLHSALPKHGDMLEGVVRGFSEVSVPNIVAEFRRLKRERAGSSLAQALLQGNDSDVESFLEKYTYYREQERAEEDQDFFIDTDIESILEGVQKENLIKVYPSTLNDKLDGGVVRGTQIAVYAPTEVGKSLFSINMACGFLHEGHKVLYCGNEDPARMMLMRFYSRLSGMDRQQMIDRPKEAREAALKNGYGNLVFYEMCGGSLFDIRKAVERHEPTILVVDQMANMETRAAYTKVEKNEYLATKLRSIAKEYGLVNIIIHQASESAYGKLIVEKNDMYFSNVGVQGQMDVMIGLGMDNQFEQSDKRMVCLTKNKISACHDSFPVCVVPKLSKVIAI
jgi:KaiC/GvpD/RAD55 family RecA-like ATPase